MKLVLFLIKKLFISKNSSLVFRLTNLVTIISLSLGVASLNIVMSSIDGFESEISKKLSNLNASYLRTQPLNNLLSRIKTKFNLNEEILERLDFLLPDLIQRYTYLNEIENDFLWLSNDFTNNVSDLNQENLNLVFEVLNILKSTEWNLIELKENIEKCLVENNLKMKDLGPILRIILTGKTNTPDIFKVIFIIGRNECIKRLTKV